MFLKCVVYNFFFFCSFFLTFSFLSISFFYVSSFFFIFPFFFCLPIMHNLSRTHTHTRTNIRSCAVTLEHRKLRLSDVSVKLDTFAISARSRVFFPRSTVYLHFGNKRQPKQATKLWKKITKHFFPPFRAICICFHFVRSIFVPPSITSALLVTLVVHSKTKQHGYIYFLFTFIIK